MRNKLSKSTCLNLIGPLPGKSMDVQQISEIRNHLTAWLYLRVTSAAVLAIPYINSPLLKYQCGFPFPNCTLTGIPGILAYQAWALHWHKMLSLSTYPIKSTECQLPGQWGWDPSWAQAQKHTVQLLLMYLQGGEWALSNDPQGGCPAEHGQEWVQQKSRVVFSYRGSTSIG